MIDHWAAMSYKSEERAPPIAVVVLVKKEGVTQVIHRKGAEEGKQNNSRREE